MCKIAIVSDSITVQNAIQAKLVLLRSDDNIIKCDTSEMYKHVSPADIILLHTREINDITLTTISNIKKSNNVIIIFVEEINPKTLLNAYDLGVSDFCDVNTTNFELLIKIINAKKALKKNRTIERYKKQLRDKGVLKQNTDVYTHINEIVNTNFYKEILNAPILAISVDEKDHSKFALNSPDARIQLRESDFIINYENFKYMIILPETQLENGVVVFEKLRKKLDVDLKGELFKYNEETAKELQKKIEHLEIEREEKKLTLLIEQEQEETESDWLSNDLSEEKPKNYKLFQNIFNNKVEKVIEPAFYRTKQKYEKNFANTKIKYFTAQNRAEFMLINFDRTNSFQIIYKNSAQIGINFCYNGLDAPENETYEIPFSQLTIRRLSEFLERFINKGEK